MAVASAAEAAWKRFAAGLPAAPEEADVFLRDGASGATPLVSAAVAGDVAGCRALLDCGAELTVNIADNAGRTALFHAANGGRDEIVRLLLDRGGSCESFVCHALPHAALFRAVERADVDEARRILEAREGFEAGGAGEPARRYARAFVAAARAGSLPLVRLMLERWPQAPEDGGGRSGGKPNPPELERHSADWIDSRDSLSGPTVADDALFNAGLGGGLDVIRFLVERQREREEAAKKVNAGERWGSVYSNYYGGYELALCAAAAAGRAALVRTLVEECGADVRKHFRRLGRPLNCAARYGHLQIVKYLVERGASPTEGEDEGAEALERAHKCTKGFSQNPDPGGWPPVLDAAGGGHVDVCKFLLERGASSTAMGRPARVGFSGPVVTVLEFAAERGQVECMRLLADAGVDVAADGCNALHLASYRGHADAVRLLTERGVPAVAKQPTYNDNVSAFDPEGTEAIFSASRGWRPDCVRALVAAGSPCSSAQKMRAPESGATPMHMACDAYGVRRALLETKAADADPAGLAAAEAVAAAAKRQWIATVQALLDGGAGEDSAMMLPTSRRIPTPVDGFFPLGIAFLSGPPLSVPHDLVRLLLGAMETVLDGQMEELLKRGVPSKAEVLVRLVGMLLAPAVAAQPADTVKLLLDYVEGLKPGSTQELLGTLQEKELFGAARNGPTARLLVQSGLPPAAVASMLVECVGDPLVAEEVLGALLDVGGPPSSPALHYACGAVHNVRHADRDENKFRKEWRPRSDATIRRLVGLGLDPNEVAPVFGSPLHVAVHHGPPLVRLLIELGARPDAMRKYGRGAEDVGLVGTWPGGTPLHDLFRITSPSPSLELVQLLMSAGAPLDAEDENGLPPLALAKPAAARSMLLRALAERLSAPGAARPPIKSGSEPQCARKTQRDDPPGMTRTTEIYGEAAGFLLAAAACAKDGALDDARTALDLLLTCDGPIGAADWGVVAKAAEAGGDAAARLVGGARRVAEGEGRTGGKEPPRQGAALAEACRHAFRNTALRLALAAPEADVDAADAGGTTPLYHAVAGGPPMLDVCLALIQRGADGTRTVGEGAARRMVLQGHPDFEFQAALKRAAGVRDVHLCRAAAPEEDEFAARLRDGLEAAHVTCVLPEAGQEGDADPEAGPRKTQAVVLVVSPAMAASARCRAELAAARRLGRPVYPVWRAKCDLDDALQGALMKQQFADLSTDALFESGLRPFALTLAQRLASSSAASAGAGPEAAAAAELAAAPEARCDPEAPGPFLFVWCHAANADFALEFVKGAARRGARCWAECSGWQGQQAAPAGHADEGALAAVRCAAFVPILSADSLSDPLLRDRLQLAELNKRPIRPVALSTAPAPDGVFAYPSFPFFTHDNVALLASLEALVESFEGASPPPAPPVSAPPAADASAERAAIEVELAQLSERAARARRLLAGGGGGGPPPPAPAGTGRGQRSPADGRASNSKACTIS